MIARTLSWFGAITLLVFGVAGVASLWIVKERIQIVVSEATRKEPDAVALLVEEARQLRNDLSALASALDHNQRQVAAALDACAGGQERIGREVVVACQHLEALERRHDLAPIQTAVGAIDSRLASIEAELTRRPIAIAPALEGPAKPAPVLPAAPPDTLAATPASPPAPGDAVSTAPAPQPGAADPGDKAPARQRPAATGDHDSVHAEPATRGFLSFQLPSAVCRFDAPQRYRIVPSLSRVGFDAKSTLHDFSGVTSQIQGEVVANLADPASEWKGEIVCEARGLTTGVADRDTAMWSHLSAGEHPRIRLAVTGFRAQADDIDVAKRRVRGTATGRLSIAGQTRALEMPVDISMDASLRVMVEGQTRIKLTDYGIEVPSKLGVISMQDEVVIWVSLRARGASIERRATDGR